jgi:hypothetical protein
VQTQRNTSSATLDEKIAKKKNNNFFKSVQEVKKKGEKKE